MYNVSCGSDSRKLQKLLTIMAFDKMIKMCSLFLVQYMTRSGGQRSKTDLLQSFGCQGAFMNGDSLIRMRLSMTTQIWRDSKGPSFTSDFTAYDPDQLLIITVIMSFELNIRLKSFVCWWNCLKAGRETIFPF